MDASLEARKGDYETARSYLESARRHYVALDENLHDIERMYVSGKTDSSQPIVRAAIDKAGQDAVYVKNYLVRLEEQINIVLGVQ